MFTKSSLWKWTRKWTESAWGCEQGCLNKLTQQGRRGPWSSCGSGQVWWTAEVCGVSSSTDHKGHVWWICIWRWTVSSHGPRLIFLFHSSSCPLWSDPWMHGFSLELLSNHGTIIPQSRYPGRACQTAYAGGRVDFEMLLMTRGCSFFPLSPDGQGPGKSWVTVLGC